MPSALTFPGVYVEEIPSGVRTIVGVPTSIAAFAGRTPRGPVQEPRTITSFADFERVFGVLDRNYPLGYAVYDFYQNGGTTAVILRLFKRGATAGVATFAVPNSHNLSLKASSPGEWGNHVGIKIDHKGITNDVAKAVDPSLVEGDFFNLTVIHNGPFGPRETFVGVTMRSKGGVRRLDRVLAAQSSFVAINGALPNAARPDDTASNADPTDPNNYKNPPTASHFVGGDAGAELDPGAFDIQQDTTDPNSPIPIPKTGIEALDKTDIFNLLVIPPQKLDTPDQGSDTDPTIYRKVLPYCVKRRAMLLVDPPSAWTEVSKVAPDSLNLSGPDARNAALYFPRVKEADSLMGGQTGTFVPSGMVAGVMARTDITRGVWKAPAGVDAALSGAQGLTVTLTDLENGIVNPAGVNCLRTFPIYGHVVWGARTMRGADVLGDEYKYVPVRRVALFIEESLYRGLKWVVFEPNDEPLWSQIRVNVGAFMQDLFRQGAFQGSSPKDAYFVHCDKTTTTQNDINLGIVNIIVGFAPLKPAEFVVLKIQQIAGQILT
jgi:Bacteriophage tail sheath protein